MNTQAQPTFSQTATVGQIECNCHDCRLLFEQASEPMHDLLAMRPNHDLLNWLQNDVINTVIPQEIQVALNFPDELRNEAIVLGSKLVRIRRIAAHHAQAFVDLDNLGVMIPFLGVAGFAANVVHNETERAIKGHLLVRLVNLNPQVEVFLATNPVIWLGYTIGRRIGWRLTGHLVKHIVYGNLLVFVEVYPIFTFCLQHFRRFGVPRGDEIAEFEECLIAFRDWWRETNTGAGDDFIKDPVTAERRMPVDIDDWVVEGIILCLRGDNLNGAIRIAQNEQLHTLQKFMYDKIDAGVFPDPNADGEYPWWADWLGDKDDLFYIITNITGAVLQFSSDLSHRNIPPQFIHAFDEGNVTEAPDRMEFTEKVITAFNTLYATPGDRSFIQNEHRLIRGHRNDQ